jgi:hypothetical protein
VIASVAYPNLPHFYLQIWQRGIPTWMMDILGEKNMLEDNAQKSIFPHRNKRRMEGSVPQ